MALIKCLECDEQISDKAEACPHCGCPLYDTSQLLGDPRETDTEVQKKGFGKIIIFIAFFTAIYFLTTEERISKFRSIILGGMNDPGQNCFEYIAKDLKDPRSAYIVSSDISGDVVEIQYRAKNSFGAYTLNTFKCSLERDGKTVDVDSTKTDLLIEKMRAVTKALNKSK